MNRTYLFAYGTLRNDFPVNENANNNLFFIGTGKINGMMYDLGDYPGAVKTNNGKTIEGDVFEVRNAENTLRILDDYEGSEYERQLERVQMTSGGAIQAWVYWYTGTQNEKNKIENGDYLAYRKTKDSLR